MIRKPGQELGRQLLERGVKVRVLTNSLASTNQPTAQSGHAKHRREVLGAGVELYELRPDSAYRVTLGEDRRVRWQTEVEGRTVTWNKSPETTFFERFKVGIYSRLPIESQL